MNRVFKTTAVFCRRNWSIKKNRPDWLHIIMLFLLITFQQIIPVGAGNLFGREGDWYTQHVAIAETLRQSMLESGKLIPQYIPLGGGSSIYDFAYYGVLRPDIIISCLFPEIKMKYFISVYALCGIYASGILGYFWLKKNGISPTFSFFGSVMLTSAACFYHSHHQIIFVNYMPFLIMALWGIQKVFEQGQSVLLITALFLIELHSFYYAPTCLCVTGVFSVHLLQKYRKNGTSGKVLIEKSLKLGKAVLISIGMAMILLLPTGIDLLSTTKDAGKFAEETVKIIDFSMEGLFHSTYGCGMTALVFYCLLLEVYNNEMRLLAGILLFCMSIPAVSLVLNGFLYARAKILIPFVPLLTFLSTNTLWKLRRGEYQHRAGFLIICLIPVLASKWKGLIALDVLILAIWIFFQTRKRERIKACTFSFCLIVPVLVSLGANAGDSDWSLLKKLRIPKAGDYIDCTEDRQEWFHNIESEHGWSSSDNLYRFEVNVNGLENCNLTREKLKRASMYSSITNDRYAQFVYDTMKNAVSYNNRVVLMAGNNPCFQYFMGIRYLLTEKEKVPAEYEVIEKRGDYVIAENKDVLPVCYGTANLISESTYKMLDFPINVEALCNGAVVADKKEGTEGFRTHFEEEDPDLFFREQGGQRILKLTGDNQEQFELLFKQRLSNKILILQFQVESQNGKQVSISINGTKNKLSAEDAPYPNHNNTFTYVMETGPTMDKLRVEASKGSYRITNLKIYSIDKGNMVHENIVIPQSEKEKNKIFKGEIAMKRDGYFITSFPYRDGYKVFVDGKEVETEVVNTAFLGFRISKGTHQVSIDYEAPGYLLGQIITMISLVLYVNLIFRLCFMRKTVYNRKELDVK